MSFSRTLVSCSRQTLRSTSSCFSKSKNFQYAQSIKFLGLRNNQCRYMASKVDTNSWAAERLLALGENLEPGPELPLTEGTVDLIMNPPDKIKNMTEDIISLNIIEINQLMRAIQTRLQYSDEDYASMIGGGGGGGGGGDEGGAAEEEVKKEKDAFDVKISAAVDAKAKIKIIKEVRAITGLGLKEAKELVESAPVVVKTGLNQKEADELKKQLETAGAQIELL